MISALDALALCEASYTEPATIQAADAHILLREMSGVLVAAFRGSASLEDWYADFCCWPHTVADHPGLGACHGKFLADALAVAPLILSAAAGRSVYAVGHSKGGAEAQLFAATIASRGQLAGLTTFGAPRVAAPGNVALAGLLIDSVGSDFAARRDPVPLAPSWNGHPRVIGALGPDGLPDVVAHYLASYAAALKAMPAAA